MTLHFTLIPRPGGLAVARTAITDLAESLCDRSEQNA